MLQESRADSTTIARSAIAVSGIAQGVGFRPFVHGLACALGLLGFVRNAVGGALLEVEGDGDGAALDRFVAELQAGGPPQARNAKAREQLPRIC